KSISETGRVRFEQIFEAMPWSAAVQREHEWERSSGGSWRFEKQIANRFFASGPFGKGSRFQRGLLWKMANAFEQSHLVARGIAREPRDEEDSRLRGRSIRDFNQLQWTTLESPIAGVAIRT